MNILYFLVPCALLMSLSFLMAFIWATRTGQWDDLDLTARKLILEKTNQHGENDEQRN